MKYTVKYETEIQVNFEAPDTALEYFTSQDFKNKSDYEFETLEEVAAIISQRVMCMGLQLFNSCFIDDIGCFDYDATSSEFFLANANHGEITIKFEVPYYTDISQEIE